MTMTCLKWRRLLKNAARSRFSSPRHSSSFCRGILPLNFRHERRDFVTNDETSTHLTRFQPSRRNFNAFDGSAIKRVIIQNHERAEKWCERFCNGCCSNLLSLWHQFLAGWRYPGSHSRSLQQRWIRVLGTLIAPIFMLCVWTLRLL